MRGGFLDCSCVSGNLHNEPMSCHYEADIWSDHGELFIDIVHIVEVGYTGLRRQHDYEVVCRLDPTIGEFIGGLEPQNVLDYWDSIGRPEN